MVAIKLQIHFELPPGAYAPGGPNVADCFLLPAPAVNQVLSLGSRGEQFGVEEFITEPSVERFGKALELPQFVDKSIGVTP